MTQINQLRVALLDVFDRVNNGQMTVATGRVLVDAAGKVIHSCKAELEYAALRSERPIIEYLGGDLSPEERAASDAAEETAVRA